MYVVQALLFYAEVTEPQKIFVQKRVEWFHMNNFRVVCVNPDLR